jgi:hypothetical protein
MSNLFGRTLLARKELHREAIERVYELRTAYLRVFDNDNYDEKVDELQDQRDDSLAELARHMDWLFAKELAQSLSDEAKAEENNVVPNEDRGYIYGYVYVL